MPSKYVQASDCACCVPASSQHLGCVLGAYEVSSSTELLWWGEQRVITVATANCVSCFFVDAVAAPLPCCNLACSVQPGQAIFWQHSASRATCATPVVSCPAACSMQALALLMMPWFVGTQRLH
jgi:hypothetical protein